MKYTLQSHVTERPLSQTASTGIMAVLAGSLPVLILAAVIALGILH